MPLTSKTCPACNEPHLLQRNGEMSIHSNAFGVRCEGSGDPQAYKRRMEQEKYPQPSRRQRSRQRKSEQKSATERNAALRLEAQRDPERQEALDMAAESAHRRYGIKPTSTEFDRRIYVVKGAHTVSGGLPTHGKRH